MNTYIYIRTIIAADIGEASLCAIDDEFTHHPLNGKVIQLTNELITQLTNEEKHSTTANSTTLRSSLSNS